MGEMTAGNGLETSFHRHSRTPERGQIHAVQPHHREAPLDRHRPTGHHPRPIYGRAHWQGHAFEVVDTGGMVPEDNAGIPGEILGQARVAIETPARSYRSSTDAPDGALDTELAQLLRRTGKPPVLAVNKVDSPSTRAAHSSTSWAPDFPDLRRARLRHRRAARRSEAPDFPSPNGGPRSEAGH